MKTNRIDDGYRRDFKMNEMHAEKPFLCDYEKQETVVMTSTAESKRVSKSQTSLKWRWTNVQCNVCLWLIWRIYRYIFLLNTLSGGKSCFVAPEVAVLPWGTETVLSPRVEGWWGQGIARAFTSCMMKIYMYICTYIHIYIYVCACVCLCVCIYLSISVCLYHCIYLYLHKHIFLSLFSLSLSFYLSLSLCPSLSLSLPLSVSVFVSLSVYFSYSIYLSISVWSYHSIYLYL